MPIHFVICKDQICQMHCNFRTVAVEEYCQVLSWTLNATLPRTERTSACHRPSLPYTGVSRLLDRGAYPAKHHSPRVNRRIRLVGISEHVAEGQAFDSSVSAYRNFPLCYHTHAVFPSDRYAGDAHGLDSFKCVFCKVSSWLSGNREFLRVQLVLLKSV